MKYLNHGVFSSYLLVNIVFHVETFIQNFGRIGMQKLPRMRYLTYLHIFTFFTYFQLRSKELKINRASKRFWCTAHSQSNFCCYCLLMLFIQLSQVSLLGNKYDCPSTKPRSDGAWRISISTLHASLVSLTSTAFEMSCSSLCRIEN